MTKTLEQIATEYRWGSEGFAIAIETHLGFGISREEIKRIAAITKTPAEFQASWENGGEWETDPLDDFNYVGSRHHY